MFQTYLKPTEQASSNVLSDGQSRWWTGIGSLFNTMSGEQVNQQTLAMSSTAFACTKALSETIAGLPDIVSTVSAGNVRNRDYKSLAYEMLALQPNDEMSSFVFWELAVTRLINWGNFFAEIQRNGADEPVALWPIHPSRVVPVRDSSGDLWFEVAHDYTDSPELSDPTWRKRHLSMIPARNMLNICGFNSQNGIIAPGVLPSISEEIGVEAAARRYGAEFFKQGSVPLGVVEHPGFFDQPDRREIFRADLNQIHRRNQVGVLWGGATWKNISVPPETAQFIETRKFSSQQICQFYGVPPAIIGDMEHSKYATADQAIRQFVMITLRNLAVRIEHAINRQVMHTNDGGRLRRAFGSNMIYNLALEGLLRGDPKTQAETNQILRTSGAITTNEIREDHGYNPVSKDEGGDMLIVNGGMAELKRINEQGERVDKAEEEPAADHSALLALLSKAAQPVSVYVNGATLGSSGDEAKADDDDEFIAPDLVALCSDMAIEACNRIHQITLSQVDRWRTQDPAEVTEKLEAFWDKQQERLAAALAPCDRVAGMVAEGTLVSDPLAEAVTSSCRKYDYHSLFSLSKTVNVAQIETFVKEKLCCS